MQRYLAQVQAGEQPWNTINPTRLTAAEIAAAPVPEALIRSVTQAPVLLMVFADLSCIASFDSELDRVGVISGASVYPFVWNILLAARNEGLGGHHHDARGGAGAEAPGAPGAAAATSPSPP